MIEVSNYSQLEEQFEQERKSDEKERIKTIISMRETLARRNANNIWGNGFTFDCPDKKINETFEKLSKRNRLNDLFHYAEFIKSLHGRVVITMNKNKAGQIMLNISDPYFYSQVGKVFITEVLAVIWQRIIVDNKHFYLRSEYTTKYVKNDWYSEPVENEKMLIWDSEKVIPKQFQVEKVWNHNLGFLPLVESFNYPYRTIMWNSYTFYQLADWYNCEFLEQTFYDLLKNLKKEVNFCHSRIGIENATQELIDTLNNKMGEDIGDYIIKTDVGSKVTAIPGVGDFVKYTNAMNEIMDFYYKFSNSSKFSEGGGAQKTSLEAGQSRANTIETIKQKITHNQSDYTQLIAKCLIAENCEMEYEAEYPFEFKINGNIQKDDTVYLDNIIKQVNLGTMSLVEAISTLRGINLTKAEETFENIQDFNEKYDIITQNSSVNMEFENDNFEGSSKQTEGGRTPDTEKTE